MADPKSKTVSLAEQYAQLQAENAALKAALNKEVPISFIVTDTGKFGITGVRKVGKPTAFSRAQWERLFNCAPDFLNFMTANADAAKRAAAEHAAKPKKTRKPRVTNGATETSAQPTA